MDTLLFWLCFHTIAPFQLLVIALRYRVTRLFAFGPNYGFLLQLTKYIIRRPLHVFLRVDAIHNHEINKRSSLITRIDTLVEAMGLHRNHVHAVSRSCLVSVMARHPRLNTISSDVFPNDIPRISQRHPGSQVSEYGTLRVACIGILEKRKNQAFLLEVMLNLKNMDITLHLFGDGPELSTLKERIINLGLQSQVTLHGWVETESIWKEIDLLLAPSLHEGAPNAILEALGYRIPVIASDIAAHREILPETALMPLNVKSWCDLIREIKLDQKNKLLELTIKTTKHVGHLYFDWDDLFRKSLDLGYTTEQKNEIRPISLAINLPRLSIGGTENIVVRILNELAKEMEIFILTKEPKGPLRNSLTESIHVISCRDSILWLMDIVIILRKIRPQLILSVFWDLNIFLSLIKILLPANIKLIIREVVTPNAHLRTYRLSLLYFILYKYCYRKADLIIAPCDGVEKEIINICGNRLHNIRVIKSCPDTKKLENIAVVDFESSQKTIVSVGRLVKQKGFDLLLRAFKGSLFEQNGYSLKIIGEGRGVKFLENMINQLDLKDNVSLVKYNENFLDIMKTSVAYVVSSHYEALSFSMLEAICLGLPVITTTNNTNAEEAIEEGKNGILIKNTDVHSIRDGLDKAYNMLGQFDRKSIAENARTEFSSVDMLARYKNSFYEVLNDSK